MANLRFPHTVSARIQDTSRYALICTELPSCSHAICAVAASSSSVIQSPLQFHSTTSSAPARTSSTPTRTSSSAEIIITSSPACTGCLLEALDPLTLTYPYSVVGNTTITTATVYAYPTYYPGGTRIYTINYSTVYVTEVLPSNQTSIVAASWSAFGTVL